MTFTITLLALAVLLFVIGLLLQAVFYQIGARLMSIPSVTFGRALLAATVINLVSLSLSATQFVWTSDDPAKGVGIVLLIFAAVQLVSSMLLTKYFKTVMWKAMFLVLFAVVGSLAASLLLAFGVRQQVVEAFQVPTNAMSPTILGMHTESVCPQCGKALYAPPSRTHHRDPDETIAGICEQFHISEQPAGDTVLPGDRVLVRKHATPKRWDVIAFYVPAEEREAIYIDRLVGMPDEKVYTHEGKLWINDQPMELPDYLAGLTYEDIPKSIFISRKVSGTKDNPAQLGPDEYFVLGDFSRASADSRVWEVGASGHPPYAVPVDHLVGVATHIYWPPSRAKVLP